MRLLVVQTGHDTSAPAVVPSKENNVPDPMPRRVVKKHRPEVRSHPFLAVAGDSTPPWDGPVDLWVDDVDGDWDDILVPEHRRAPRSPASERVVTDK